VKSWTLAALCAALLPAAPSDPWLRIQSQNFQLFTTTGERNGRDLVNHFEQVRAFFYEAFGSKPISARPARIIVFRNDKEYEPYRPNQSASAFYQPGSDHDFIVMRNAAGVDEVAVHEYTHLLVGQSGQTIPIWLNEGLAELYSNLDPLAGQIVVGKPLRGRVHALGSEKWIPIRTLMAADRDSPFYQEKSRAGMFYAESWILVHMLVLSREYRPKLHAMLEALKETGTSDDGSARALETAYGKSIEEIEKDLRSYMAATTLAAAVFDAPSVKPVAELEVDRNAGMAARLALAELTTVTPGKSAQARAAYAQLERDYANRWEVQQSVADFDLRERRNSEAAEHYAIAVELGAKDAELHVRYARALSLTNRDDDAIKALRTAVSLDPAMDEAHFELGLGLVRAGQYREAAEQFGKIKRLGPEHASRFYYSFAFASYKLGDRVRARTLIREARSYTKNPEELAALDKLSEAVGR
jgi:hypothetical protein